MKWKWQTSRLYPYDNLYNFRYYLQLIFGAKYHFLTISLYIIAYVCTTLNCKFKFENGDWEGQEH